MKFRILCNFQNPTVPNSEWWEHYDKPEVTNQAEADAWGKEIIEFFNSTLREHERARIFISAEILGNGTIPHDWEKTNLVTVSPKRGLMYDTYKCLACGVTGKRYGLSDHISRDAKYKAAKYDSCVSSI